MKKLITAKPHNNNQNKNFITKSDIFDSINILSTNKNHLETILKHTASEEERFIHNQAKLRIRFKDKFPSIIENKLTILPPRINCEQSSSSATSNYKIHLISQLFNKNIVAYSDAKTNTNYNKLPINILDATCGFGIDSYGIAKIAKNVISLDINSDLIKINKYNTKALGITNLNFINLDFKTYLSNNLNPDDNIVLNNEITFKFDLIYLDPSRRDNSGNKVFKIEDLEPNLYDIFKLLKSKTNKVLIKFSPLIDVTYLIKSFENLTEIHIVEYDSELKEILIVLDFENSQLNNNLNNINIYLAQIKDNIFIYKTHSFNRNINFNQIGLTYSEPLNYLYEPSVGEMKLSYWNEFGGFYKLSLNTNLFTTGNLEINFKVVLGKFYKILQISNVDKNSLNKLGITKANIKVRNSSLTIDEAYKKLGIKSGGEIYIFLVKNLDNKNIMIICEKL